MIAQTYGGLVFFSFFFRIQRVVILFSLREGVGWLLVLWFGVWG